MTLDELRYPAGCVRTWLATELQQRGPWNDKLTLKEQVNCLLHYKLSGLSNEALNIRGYLCNHDSDAIWANSMQQHILPYVYDVLVEEVLHG